MIKIFLGFVFSLLLLGCGSQKLTDTQTVYVPVVTKCEPTTNITEIETQFDKAEKEMSLYEKTQLLAADNYLLKGQNKELKAALQECTK